ncbi:MAG: hypothetical protein J6Y20_11045 [Lachnospiraceae bacterium]|nr:hypothetical protein [Lachnospiraceae bacterium]
MKSKRKKRILTVVAALVLICAVVTLVKLFYDPGEGGDPGTLDEIPVTPKQEMNGPIMAANPMTLRLASDMGEPVTLTLNAEMQNEYNRVMRNVTATGTHDDVNPKDVQKGINLICDAIATGGDPLKVAVFAGKNILPLVLNLPQDKSDQQKIMDQFDKVLKNQQEMINSLHQIREDIMKSELAGNLNQFYDIDSAKALVLYYELIEELERSDDANLTQAELDDLAAQRRYLMDYSFTGESDGGKPDDPTPVSDSLCDLDKRVMQMGSYLCEGHSVTYGGGADNLFGIYHQWCKYKYKWEHQAYDDWMSFRNSAYIQYMVSASIDRMSLVSRIENRKEAGYAHSTTLEGRLSQLEQQIKDVAKAFSDSSVVIRSDEYRYYQYPGHECLLYAKAKKQVVPMEPDRKSGVDVYNHKYTNFPQGLRNKGEGKIWVNLEFWRTFISYNKDSGGTSLCPTVEWFKGVYGDYGGTKNLWQIFFDPNEGNMQAPEGSNNSSWRFMVDPCIGHEMTHYDGGFWRADQVATPMIDFYANEDLSGRRGLGVDFYTYHYTSNEINEDFEKNIGGVIGIGRAD